MTTTGQHGTRRGVSRGMTLRGGRATHVPDPQLPHLQRAHAVRHCRAKRMVTESSHAGIGSWRAPGGPLRPVAATLLAGEGACGELAVQGAAGTLPQGRARCLSSSPPGRLGKAEPGHRAGSGLTGR